VFFITRAPLHIIKTPPFNGVWILKAYFFFAAFFAFLAGFLQPQHFFIGFLAFLAGILFLLRFSFNLKKIISQK